MARMGRPPKPTEAKRRIGNPGGRPLPKGNVIALDSLRAVVVTGDSPGDELVARILGTAASNWIAESDAVGTLALLRDGWNERARLRATVDQLPDDWGLGRYTPAVLIRLAQVEKDLTTWLSQLGLNPVDRGRLGVAEVKVQTKLADLRARRDSRSRAG